MEPYITKIIIHNLFHLHDLEIPIADSEHPHLIITGRNGSGKTVLLNAVADFLGKIKDDSNLNFLEYRNWEKTYRTQYESATEPEKKSQAKIKCDEAIKRADALYGKVEPIITQPATLIQKYKDGVFFLAFYQANRRVQMIESQNPVKPNIHNKGDIKKTSTDQFLNFLTDLKFREALARTNNRADYADGIQKWFISFENLLKRIFQDNELRLEFNIVDYSFRIVSGDNSFKFNEMSDGFAAIIDIVADMILKMENPENPAGIYLRHGIVLIDEIETHLHPELQKLVLPMLTEIFPNIQFIISTHSPFVLNSLSSATAYDLEHQKTISGLTEYSYTAISEGYFGVSSESSYATSKLEKLEKLLSAKELNNADKRQAISIINDFKNVPDALSPNLVGQYRELMNKYHERVFEFGL